MNFEQRVTVSMSGCSKRVYAHVRCGDKTVNYPDYCDSCKSEFKTLLRVGEWFVESIDKDLERLNGYSCGYHKQLVKQMGNRRKMILRALNDLRDCISEESE